jgi:hypothetical protein
MRKHLHYAYHRGLYYVAYYSYQLKAIMLL